MIHRAAAVLWLTWALAGTPVAAQDRVAPGRDLPQGPVSVTVVGTSLTANAAWPDALGPRLTDCLGRAVEVERVARPAATSDWGLEQLNTIAAMDPDIVVIEFAINDADVKIGAPLALSRSRHETLLRDLRIAVPDAAIYLMTTNPALGRMAGRRPVLAAYYAMYRDLAAIHDTGLADGYRRWRMRGDLRLAIPDGLHPTDKDTTMVVLESLAPLMAETFGVSGPAC